MTRPFGKQLNKLAKANMPPVKFVITTEGSHNNAPKRATKPNNIDDCEYDASSYLVDGREVSASDF